VKGLAGCLLAVVAVAGCGGDDSRHHVKTAALGYDVPADWTSDDHEARGLSTSVWTPPVNDHKESISIVRNDRRANVASADLQTIERLLVEAQPPGAELSVAHPILTRSGLRGVQLESSFVPSGFARPYHRVHAVLVDGTTLVNVMYTARDADPKLEAFELVMSSIRHEEG
jgi:hypothetical protein